MPLADLLQAIEADAAADRARADREASAAAEAILERARRDAGALERDLAATRVADARQESDRLLGRARTDASGMMRTAREQAFTSLLTALGARLGALRGTDAYPALFAVLLAESQAALPAARELRVDPRDLALAVPRAGGLRIETTLDTWGGVELASDDGRTLRNTLEERLANAEQLLRRRFACRVSTPADTS